MKLIIFTLLFILPLHAAGASTDLAVPLQHVECHPSTSFSCHSSAQTLESRKIQAHYATFSIKPVSATYMTENNLILSPVSFQHGIRKKKRHESSYCDDRKPNT